MATSLIEDATAMGRPLASGRWLNLRYAARMKVRTTSSERLMRERSRSAYPRGVDGLERALVATRRAPARALDVALLLALAGLYLIEVRPPWDTAPLVLGPYAQPDGLSALLLAAAIAPLWWRRGHPGRVPPPRAPERHGRPRPR
jgi:hypothetical protein